MSTTVKITRLAVTHSDELTRASAREFRALLRKAGVEPTIVEGFTAHTSAHEAILAADLYGVAVALVRYEDMTPAQRGAITRKRNTRLAKKAARKAAPSTGYVKEQIRARKSA